MFDRITRCARKRSSADDAEPFGKVVVPDDVSVCHGEDGLVLLHIRKGIVYKSNRTGSRVWQSVVEGRKPLAALIREIVVEHGLSIELVRQDVNAFLTELTGEGLLVRAE